MFLIDNVVHSVCSLKWVACFFYIEEYRKIQTINEKESYNKLGENIEIEIIPQRELFYNNDFGVYACECKFEQSYLVTLNTYGNFVINGAMPKLSIGGTYHAQIEQVDHKKYGLSYEVRSIRQEMPKTLESQHAYLRSVLAESYADSLIKHYPTNDIIDLIKTDKLDYNSIKGIGEKTYLKIKEKVIDNFEIQEALAELSQYGVTYKIIKKLIAHFGNSPSIVVQKVKNNPYALTIVDGLGFLKVDEYALKMGIVKDSPHRINSAIDYTLKQEENNGHCWISVNSAASKVSEITELTSDKINEYLTSENIDDFYLVDNKIGLMRNYKYERQIKDDLLRLLNHSGNFKVKNIEDKIRNVETEQGFDFTDEQRNAIYDSVKHNVIVISGKAGTGKSTILKGILSTLDDYTYETCAFSGKASQRIVESTGLKSKTIHRLLEFKPPEGFQYRRGSTLNTNIVVLDEASMVNNYLFYSLIGAIETGTKFIVLGDIEQLAPIGSGNILRDMIESGVIPVVELTQVHRQALKSGILLAANQVREGMQITEYGDVSSSIVGELKDLYIVPKESDEDIKKYILDLCMKTIKNVDIMDFQVIVPMKTRGVLATKNLNVDLQQIFNPDDSATLKRNGYSYKVGDKIIKSGNDYENGVFNGTLGMIVGIDDKEKIAEIKFVGNEESVFYTQEELNQIDMAYALTVHRCQGSQFKHVIIGLDYSAYVLLSRQLVYTALTRAAKKCVLVCNNDALRHAIGKNDSAKRNTFLKDMLVGREVD